MPSYPTLPAYRSCQHLACRHPRGKPSFEIRDEFFGIGAIGDRAAAVAEPAHGLDIGRNLPRLAHGLWIIAGEDELRQRKFLQAEAHQCSPYSAARSGPAQ